MRVKSADGGLICAGKRFFDKKVIKISHLDREPNLILNGIPIYRKFKYLSQAVAWHFQLQERMENLLGRLTKEKGR
ncbi:hypothetical protein MLOOGBEN_09950 [Bacillus sp. EB106-08-02-XG196]|jgi:hypothetical protein|uniref:hypothetical protein n=1 Tax=Bacillus sp. EB106-08-02-XG196 TaxID=2737049 RepID=UPI0015C4AD53|nr:hypothetical protein [Bacillus sp. EB106-08-02-XG196]NWQ41017.1 hypothetical protein [Bacillus sp. EB106-08-02-XG196]